VAVFLQFSYDKRVTDKAARSSILQSAGLASRYPTLGKFVLGAADPVKSNDNDDVAAPVVDQPVSSTSTAVQSQAAPTDDLSIASPPPPVVPDLAPSPALDPVSPPPTSVPTPPPAASTDDEDLELLDNLVATTLLSRPQDQPQPTTGSRQKELLETAPAPVDSAQEATQEAAPEAGTEAAPAAESPELQELTAELREVSKETKEQREQAEIKEKQAAISELAKTAITPVSVSDKPVVVLPITAKSKEEARFKSPKHSVVWLWEWCKKIAKIFDGAVVYKEEVENPPAA
jgi:hypothetical protein